MQDSRWLTRTRLRALALLALLGLWTWKLLEPVPLPPSITAELSDTLRFLAAKCLHASAYAILTLLTVTLPLSNRWRWLLAGLLALHGVATEIGQTFVPGRGGSVRDVLIDWAGIAVGVAVWRVFLASGGRKSSD